MESFKLFESVHSEHEILNMYYSQNQYKISDISELTGISTAGIYRILKKHEISPHRRETAAGQYETIYHFADTGIPPKKIAELSGYSLRQVYNILNGRLDYLKSE